MKDQNNRNENDYINCLIDTYDSICAIGDKEVQNFKKDCNEIYHTVKISLSDLHKILLENRNITTFVSDSKNNVYASVDCDIIRSI